MCITTKPFSIFVVIVFALLITQISIPAQSAFPDSSLLIILLNNDRIVEGEILSSGDVVQVRSELGLITIPRSDIVLVATTLREVYQFKKENTLQTSDCFLKLADWCVTNQLVDEAAVEFDRAILLADHTRQTDAIRSRKNAVLSMYAERHRQVDMIEQVNQKYRQWKEKIPASTFATFKREILPMLVQNCNGIACHSSNSLNEFRFIANPNNNDIDVAKNLQIVLRYVTPDVPEESPLVLIPIAPHGRTKQIFTHQNSLQYRKLDLWVEQVAKVMDTWYPLDETDRQHQLSMTRSGTKKLNPTTTISPGAGGNTPSRLPGESLVDNPQSGNTQTAHMPVQNPGTSVFSQPQRAAFDFLGQRSIVPGTSPGGWQGPAQDQPGMQNNRETNVITHNSTEDFVLNSRLQQMQHAPFDPFDPVLFNRQYHFQRIQENQQ